jgi:hypothetical protein
MLVCKWKVGALALLLAGSAQVALAQSTDGYHAIQVFPIVVDSASFAQRFHFRAPYTWDGGAIAVKFYPAQGTAQVGPLTCPSFSLPELGERRFSSLRELCPGLAPGTTAFGTLVVSTASSQSFAGFSRVSNPQGNGFSVEAFPANTFTSAISAVTGLRRLAAQGGAPAFQSNCFVGNLAELAPTGVPVATEVTLSLADASGVLLGQAVVAVKPGEIVRLLDVFAAADLPAGNYDDVVATFEGYGPPTGLLTFCTVQDNTSFGADFRIGKQELAFGGIAPGAQDEGAARWSFGETEEAIDNQGVGAPLAIPAGASRNVHQFYFRHPDVISCGLVNTTTFEDATPAYGLELRLRVHDPDGWRVLAGGNDIVQFSDLYLGDKAHHGDGANTTYQIEVESNGQNAGANRPYTLVCISGSGHSKGELLRKGLGITF